MKYLIRICAGARCKACFSDDLFRETRKLIREKDNIEVETRSCMGICHLAPNVEVINTETSESKIYNQVSENDLPGIIKELD